MNEHTRFIQTRPLKPKINSDERETNKYVFRVSPLSIKDSITNAVERPLAKKVVV